MSKKNPYFRDAKKTGIAPVDFGRMQAIAKTEAARMEKQAIEKAFLYMLAIPLNVLASEYWSKTAKRKAPKYIEEVISLYESVQAGVVSDEDLADFLHDVAGVTIEAEWLKKKGGVTK